jgi:hypothetical protein
MKIRLVKEAIATDVSDIVKDTLGPKFTVRPFKNNILTASPGGFFSPSRLQMMADQLNKRIPESWLESPVSVGTGGATEGLLIIRLTDEGIKHTNLFEAEEDFTPIEDPKEPKPAAKQFQILASMITNTKVNDQTNILSAMRALPGVTIVNSQAAIPGSNSEGQLRYKTNVDIKIDTSAIEGDVKVGIKKIIEDIKKIEGVVEFKVVPKAKETTPY